MRVPCWNCQGKGTIEDCASVKRENNGVPTAKICPECEGSGMIEAGYKAQQLKERQEKEEE